MGFVTRLSSCFHTIYVIPSLLSMFTGALAMGSSFPWHQAEQSIVSPAWHCLQDHLLWDVQAGDSYAKI